MDIALMLKILDKFYLIKYIDMGKFDHSTPYQYWRAWCVFGSNIESADAITITIIPTFSKNNLKQVKCCG